jgi:peroxiredoxin
VIEQLEREPQRVPAEPQPDLTVTQREEMKDYVRDYLEGRSMTRVSKKKYAPVPASERKTGPGERAELKGKPLPFQTLRCVDGTTVELAQFVGKQDLLIVVLRGFSGEVCPYCMAQTKALAQSKVRLDELGVEVLVIYPGPKENQAAFTKAYKAFFDGEVPPYRVFYDPDLEIVETLGISGELAFPTTLIVGKDGLVSYAYVGEHVADRPAALDLRRPTGRKRRTPTPRPRATCPRSRASRCTSNSRAAAWASSTAAARTSSTAGSP